MKAITLWQPWASLLACGAKRYETRSWATNYRGPIAIHAAAKDPQKQYNALSEGTQLAISEIFQARTCLNDLIPRGCVIAIAELVDCHLIVERVPEQGNDYGFYTPACSQCGQSRFVEISDQEHFFGDWTPGRYAWEFANMSMLSEPIPAKGMHGLWNWEDGR